MTAGIPASADAAYHEDDILTLTETIDVHLNVRWNERGILANGEILSEMPCDILIVLEAEDGTPVSVVPVQYNESSIFVEFATSDTGLNPTITRWQIRVLPWIRSQ